MRRKLGFFNKEIIGALIIMIVVYIIGIIMRIIINDIAVSVCGILIIISGYLYSILKVNRFNIGKYVILLGLVTMAIGIFI